MLPDVTLDDGTEMTDQELADIALRVRTTRFTVPGLSSNNRHMIDWNSNDSPAQCASDRARLWRLLNSKQRRL